MWERKLTTFLFTFSPRYTLFPILTRKQLLGRMKKIVMIENTHRSVTGVGLTLAAKKYLNFLIFFLQKSNNSAIKQAKIN